MHDICCSCTILDASYLNVFHISVGSGNGNPELVALPLYIRCGYRYGIIYIAGKKKKTPKKEFRPCFEKIIMIIVCRMVHFCDCILFILMTVVIRNFLFVSISNRTDQRFCK